MDILTVLIPIALVLLAAIVGLFLWSIRSGQFDDLEGPAHRILMDDDKRPGPPKSVGDGERSVDAEQRESRPGE